MEKETNEVKALKHFAEEELKNHLAELYTLYQNEPLSSKELKQQAYKEHQKIYNQELEDKIQSLLSTENPWLKDELESLKHSYVTKLFYNNFLNH
jgi:hypothetical protein